MDEDTGKTKIDFSFGRVIRYFLQGLIVIAPIGITIYAVLWLFRTVDNILPNIIAEIFPGMLQRDAEGALKTIPGLGFIVVILIVVFVGWLSSLFFVERLVHVFDKVLEKTPGIRFIYSSVKDFLEAFAGNKKKFDKPVLVTVDAENIWRIGFITQHDASQLGLTTHIVVYVPHSYAISGITYIVPREKVRPLQISASEAMKFVVSGGISDVDQSEKN
jgi:uncharacterized membrane protein